MVSSISDTATPAVEPESFSLNPTASKSSTEPASTKLMVTACVFTKGGEGGGRAGSGGEMGGGGGEGPHAP